MVGSLLRYPYKNETARPQDVIWSILPSHVYLQIKLTDSYGFHLKIHMKIALVSEILSKTSSLIHSIFFSKRKNSLNFNTEKSHQHERGNAEVSI